MKQELTKKDKEWLNNKKQFSKDTAEYVISFFSVEQKLREKNKQIEELAKKDKQIEELKKELKMKEKELLAVEGVDYT